MAQHVQIPAFDEAITYVVGATPQSAFDIPFPFWSAADIVVSIDGAQLVGGYSVQGAFVQNGDPVEGAYGSGTLTLNAPVSNCTVLLDRLVEPVRETDFSKTGPLSMNGLNSDLDKLTARQQDVSRLVRRIQYEGLTSGLDAAGARAAIGADQSANVQFNLGAVGSVTRSLADRAAERVSVRDFGAIGDNFADDTDAINAAIAWCNAQVFPVDLHLPRGFYTITAALTPIRGPTRLVGCGPRNTVLNFFGDYDCITFAGDATGWIGHCGILDIGLFCSGMTGGRTIVADNALGGEVRNVLCDAPYSFAHLQQASNWIFELVDAQPVRGDYGIKWIGTNTMRNGRIDKSDVLTLRDVTVHGLNIGGSGSTAEGLWLEGYVHTLVISNVRILAMKRGLLATNQSGVPANLVPSFALGAGLEIENPYHEGIRLEAMTGLWVNGLFCVGSTADCGIHIGEDARQVHLHGGRIAGNFTDGVYSEGYNFSLTGIDIYNNSRFASDSFCGVRLVGGSTVLIGQCMIGRPDGEPTYTEQQKVGVWNNSDVVAKISIVASDLTGNVTGSTSGTMTVTGCFTD